MFFGAFVMAVALGLSAVAAYYSIVGLVAIFAAAALPIIVMGSILEVAKITVTVWLHQHWSQCKWLMKAYLTAAIVALMFITSMGIYGYLSKAHIDQGLSAGNVEAQLADLDRQIRVHEKVIVDANTVIAQLDQAVQSLIDAQRIRGAGGSLAVRESQKAERESLNQHINEANQAIAVLSEKRLPFAQSQQKLEAEVGPLKYIAALIYGNNVDNGLLENAVRWVIILIVFVFDPLAIMMVLAATESFKWAASKPVAEPTSEPDANNLAETEVVLPPAQTPAEPEPIEPEPIEPEPIEPKLVDTPQTPSYNASYAPVTVEFGNYLLTASKQNASAPAETLLADQPPAETLHSVVKEIVARQKEESAAIAKLSGVEDSTPDMQFGVKYPSAPKKGDMFLRVDFLPTRLYRFTGTKWVEVNKENTNYYAYDEAYIDMLASKISQGEYNVDWLTPTERKQIDLLLQQNTLDERGLND